MDEHIKTIDQLPSIFSKNFLEELIKEYPKFDQPNLLESEGNIKFVDEKGHAVQLKVVFVNYCANTIYFKRRCRFRSIS